MAVDISFSDRDEILGLCGGIFKLVVSRNMLFELAVTRPFESLGLGVVTAESVLGTSILQVYPCSSKPAE
jgi:hypothetical protein